MDALVKLFLPLVDVIEDWSSFLYAAVQIAGNAIFFFGIVLIECCVLAVARVALPVLASPGSFSFFILFMLTCVLSFGILFNFIASAVFRSPFVSSEVTEQLAREAEGLPIRQQRLLLDAPLRFCDLCHRFKAPREHHCRVCRRCVAKMDHHCPWINNCVDAENHRYFLLFVVYLLMGSFIATCVLSLAYIRVELHVRSGKSLSTAPFGVYSYQIRSLPVFLTMILSSTIFLCMIFFTACNVFQLLRNETQVERHLVERKVRISRNSMTPFRNPYDLGRWRNMLEVFHTKGDLFVHGCKKQRHISLFQKVLLVFWIIMPTVRPSRCDGMHYPTFHDEVMSL